VPTYDYISAINHLELSSKKIAINIKLFSNAFVSMTMLATAGSQNSALLLIALEVALYYLLLATAGSQNSADH
jgi:hypothetical protein